VRAVQLRLPALLEGALATPRRAERST
jgi:hypothetical protein